MVVARLLDRLDDQLVVALVAQVRPSPQGRRSRRAGRGHRQDLVEHRDGAQRVPGVEEVVGRRDPAGDAVREVVLGCAPDRKLAELGRRFRRAAGAGMPRGVLQRRSDGLVGALRGQGEVASSGLNVPRGARQREVRPSPIQERGPGRRGRGQQGMSESDPARRDLDDAGPHRVVQALERLVEVADRPAEEVHGGVGGERREEHDVPRRVRQRSQAVQDEVVQGRRDRERLACPVDAMELDQPARDLEREERVASGGLVQADERGPRE
jgi:hypothetical protein